MKEDELKEINVYLDKKYAEGEIMEELYKDAKKKVIPRIKEWMADENIDRILPSFRKGVERAIREKRGEELTFAFLDDIAFGTGGIRGIVALTEDSLKEFAEKGVKAEILRGPNTINEIVLLLKSAGVANYAAKNGLKGVVIGFDSRIQGKTFASLIAKTFLARGLIVYLFDSACPFPELTFAVPFLKADIGILISASHNDKRYNGYKLVSSTGAQFNISERNYIYEKFIKTASTKEIRLMEFQSVKGGQLIFLGGDEHISGENYYGKKLIDMHRHHINHIKNFIMDKPMLKEWAKEVNVGYSAFYGAGRKAVPHILKDFGFTNLRVIHSLNELNGMFPCFALEQQPDPGDPFAEEIAVNEFKKEYGEEVFRDLDILIGTDPDSDRIGLIIKIPENQQNGYKKIIKRKESSDYSWMLLDADSAWTLLLWYRLKKEAEKNNGIVPEAEKKFIVLNHTTTDALVSLAKKHHLGSIKTWVGFAMLADSVNTVWKDKKISEEDPIVYETTDMDSGLRSINVGAFEQSNGFSILGGPPSPGERLGKNGHVRDKDGVLAAILLAEVAAYAKSKGTTILELIDENIYLDPEIGCFITCYEPAPYWGQYEGPTGISTKINILRRADNLKKKVDKGETVVIAGKKVLFAESYCTGKYDELHRWKGFPDEGIRLFFDKSRNNHLTIRPSGTSQCLRFHAQIKAEGLTRENLIEKKVEAYALAQNIIGEIRDSLQVE